MLITLREIESLRGLTSKNPSAVKLSEDLTLLYSSWFAMELRNASIEPTFSGWDREICEVARNWRCLLPSEEGEYAQAIRWTNPDDGVALIKLMSDSSATVIHPAVFEFVNKKLTEPEFHVFRDENAAVAIYSEGICIGGVSRMLV